MAQVHSSKLEFGMRLIVDESESIDPCSEIGARRIAARIKEYWLARGFRGITTGVMQIKTPKQKRRGLDPPIFGVISNIAGNGYPPK